MTVSLAGKRFSPRTIVFILGLVALVGFFVVLFVMPSKSAFVPLPDPNGYYVMLQAASRIESGGADLTTNEIVELVIRNKAALSEIRRALDLPCAVPVRMDQRWVRRHSAELSSFRRVAQACDQEALLLQGQGANSEALDRCLELTRFSHAISRNGLLVTALQAMACETIATKRLTNILSGLSAADCRKGAHALYEYDRDRESPDEIGRREAEWSRATYGVWAQLPLMVRGGTLRPDKAAMSSTEKIFYSNSRLARVTILQLASRAFELEHGRKPQRSSELVPAFLPSVPIDPASHAPLEIP